MNQLTTEQMNMIRNLAIEKGYDPDKADHIISRILVVVEDIAKSMRAAFNYLKERMKPILQAYKRYWHQQNVKFFKKKKSQRKNWGKWKKRK